MVIGRGLAATFVSLAFATPAHGAVTVAAEVDPRDLAASPERDLQQVRSTYESAGTWTG